MTINVLMTIVLLVTIEAVVYVRAVGSETARRALNDGHALRLNGLTGKVAKSRNHPHRCGGNFRFTLLALQTKLQSCMVTSASKMDGTGREYSIFVRHRCFAKRDTSEYDFKDCSSKKSNPLLL